MASQVDEVGPSVSAREMTTRGRSARADLVQAGFERVQLARDGPQTSRGAGQGTLDLRAAARHARGQSRVEKPRKPECGRREHRTPHGALPGRRPWKQPDLVLVRALDENEAGNLRQVFAREEPDVETSEGMADQHI